MYARFYWCSIEGCVQMQKSNEDFILQKLTAIILQKEPKGKEFDKDKLYEG